MKAYGIEPLVDRGLELRLGLVEQFAHLLDAGGQFDNTLVGELRGGSLLGGAL